MNPEFEASLGYTERFISIKKKKDHQKVKRDLVELGENV
jgi:hypothetical protein